MYPVHGLGVQLSLSSVAQINNNSPFSGPYSWLGIGNAPECTKKLTMHVKVE